MKLVLFGNCYLRILDLFLQAFVKVIKNKAYFKRFQVKFKRRRGQFTSNLKAIF